MLMAGLLVGTSGAAVQRAELSESVISPKVTWARFPVLLVPQFLSTSGDSEIHKTKINGINLAFLLEPAVATGGMKAG